MYIYNIIITQLCAFDGLNYSNSIITHRMESVKLRFLVCQSVYYVVWQNQYQHFRETCCHFHSNLKMVAASSIELPVRIRQTTWRLIPDRNMLTTSADDMKDTAHSVSKIAQLHHPHISSRYLDRLLPTSVATVTLT